MPSPLRQRSIGALITAQVVSALGTQMTFLALPWFVLETTGSATRMGVVLAVEILPVAVLGIPSGAIVARLGARNTMLLGDLARAPLMVSVPLLHQAGLLTFPLLLVIVALVGVFIAPYFSSQVLVLPEILGDDERLVSQANAIVEGARRATALLGPALAGVLIATIGATNVLYVDAATFLISFAVLGLFVPQHEPAQPDETSRGVLAGIRFLFRDRVLRVLGVTAMVANGLGMMLAAGLPVLAFEEFDGSSRVAGAFFAALGAGAVAGSIVAVRVVGRHDPLRLGATAFVALTLPVFVLGLELPVVGVMAALAVSSFFGPLVNAPLIAVITTRTPPRLRPKVTTAVITVAMLAGPVGYAIAGPLLESLGPRTVFLIVAAGQLLATIPFAAVAFRQPPAAAPEPA
ncbi:MAG: MFS transporter [Thermoleophilia bacterium]|nr:MFS transporter [Thermoleophilia bacterium]MDH5333058.1 MFS transporter [Thermoleophilia bacterium]